ncbi:D-alanyl-D-alanine carboxypeptidase/D-alanyl-D-alanine-endopeptidase [Brevibacillus fluminis]|uniref:D-alanyl-D-alanine carboxypeptidase/D-alanyl-D-alanine-endopeptidase n=1 Tax=Brevibacillus fluminis TaxID=511487 RepID=A0A3M8DIF8_9BACL|nr:D-alanyl-D-alanine carboxypeptidase/D-alanyl-D-alanine-endopeptidase [Brevibacillus fluminis]RNB87155.1 D-alanyl-D-alanine carboxypeptidase/D-alanyl-D-alanine-endopeptidase [Brevibacillus fluminis]
MKKTYRNPFFKWLMAFSLLLQLAAVPTLASAHTADPMTAQVDAVLYALEQNPESIGMQSGISIYDLTKDKMLYSHNADKNYVPASNMKLFTGVTALDRLGPDYTFKTEVFVKGGINARGQVTELILKGYGDPTLTEADLEELAHDLKEKGVTTVRSRLLLDDSYFDDVRLGAGWMWDDEPYGYSAQLSALALHKNFVTLTVTPGKSGKKAEITLDPQTDTMAIDNQVKTVDGKTADVTVTRARGKNVVTVTGTIGVDASSYQEDVSIENPTLYVGNVWKRKLEEAGIKLGSSIRIQTTDKAYDEPVVTHESRPLGEIMVELNKESDNFYAEQLLKTLGAVEKRKGSAEAGAEVVADFLNEAGITTGYSQADGSGLSRYDLITTEQMVQLLRYVQEKPYSELLESTLPIAGVDGTLANRLKGTPAEKNLIAKTGSMSGVNSLSGYVTAKNGDKLAFSIITNGIYKSKYARSLQDQVAVLMASYPELDEPGDDGLPEPEAYKLSDLLDPILDAPEATGVSAGIIVKALDEKGKEATWYAHDADKLMTPASNLKLLTGATALTELGSDYRFKTELSASTPVTDDGLLKGNLYVKGYGDPSIHTEDELKAQDGVSIESIVDAIKKRGIKRINGDLILDDTYFDDQRLGLGWAWDDESYYYNALIDALSLNRGTVMISYEPGARKDKPVKVTITPNTSYVTVINEAKTVAKDEENTFTILRDRATDTIRLQGNLPLGSDADYERVPVEQPALYFGTVLKEKLEEAGIKFTNGSEVKRGELPTKVTKLKVFQSEPLADILTYMNKKSDNLYAEMLLKAVGAKANGSGTADAGIEAVQAVLKSFGWTTNFDMVDGSGLTRYDQISARHITAALEGMAAAESFDIYYDSLPIAGVDGTLKNRMKGTAAENNVHAKTGSMSGVNSLSGYVTTKGGTKLVFSILLNGYATSSKVMTSIQDEIVEALANYEE